MAGNKSLEKGGSRRSGRRLRRDPPNSFVHRGAAPPRWKSPAPVRCVAGLRAQCVPVPASPHARHRASGLEAQRPAAGEGIRQTRPSRRWPSQLNRVSRTRSGVGRKTGRSGSAAPATVFAAMMRTLLFALAFNLSAHDHRAHRRRSYPCAEGAQDVVAAHRCHPGGVGIQPVRRQTVKAITASIRGFFLLLSMRMGKPPIRLFLA